MMIQQEERERIEFIERQAKKEREERQRRREEVTKRVFFVSLPIVVVVSLCAAILTINHVILSKDPNPTCDVSLHLRPGETATFSCPTTITHDTEAPRG